LALRNYETLETEALKELASLFGIKASTPPKQIKGQLRCIYQWVFCNNVDASLTTGYTDSIKSLFHEI
jgi:hypothetical protein